MGWGKGIPLGRGMKEDRRVQVSYLRRCNATASRSQVLVRTKCARIYEVHGLFMWHPGPIITDCHDLSADIITSARQTLASILPWGTSERTKPADWHRCTDSTQPSDELILSFITVMEQSGTKDIQAFSIRRLCNYNSPLERHHHWRQGFPAIARGPRTVLGT